MSVRTRLNPFISILDADIRNEFITQHFIEGLMIDCAKQALCVHTQEIKVVKQKNLERYDGIRIGDAIIPDKRIDIRGLRFFLDFIETKLLSTNLERSSAEYFNYTEIMATFMNYVNVYAFRNGVQPGRREAWTADRSHTLRGNRGGIEHPSLLAYLNELRQRVETHQPLCETTPNIYLDIPISDDAPPIADGGPIRLQPSRPVAPVASAAPAPLLASAAPKAPQAPQAPPAVQFANQASDPAESVTAGRPTEATPLFSTARPGLRPILKPSL
jgi:hypothetical protein